MQWHWEWAEGRGRFGSLASGDKYADRAISEVVCGAAEPADWSTSARRLYISRTFAFALPPAQTRSNGWFLMPLLSPLSLGLQQMDHGQQSFVVGRADGALPARRVS